MRHVSIIDATRIQTLKEIYSESTRHHIKIIISELNSVQVLKELKDAQLLFAIGKANIISTFDIALERAQKIILS